MAQWSEVAPFLLEEVAVQVQIPPWLLQFFFSFIVFLPFGFLLFILSADPVSFARFLRKRISSFLFWSWLCSLSYSVLKQGILRGCSHDTGATFAPERVHSGSLSWLYICLHDTTTKCRAGASHPGLSSPRFLYRGENFTLVRNLASVSCKRETTTRFGVKSVCR